MRPFNQTSQIITLSITQVFLVILLLVVQSSQVSYIIASTTQTNEQDANFSTTTTTTDSSTTFSVNSPTTTSDLVTTSLPTTQLRPTRLKSPSNQTTASGQKTSRRLKHQQQQNRARQQQAKFNSTLNNRANTNQLQDNLALSPIKTPSISELISASQLSSLSNNTPPLFLPNLQNLFIDVGKPRALLDWSALVQAHDQDGDKLNYSLRASNWLHHDASKFMKINSQTGLLTFAINESEFIQTPDDSHLIDESEDQHQDAEDHSVSLNSDETSTTSSSLGPETPNTDHAKTVTIPSDIYFLNVVANDGHEDSIFEIRITIKNSSQLAGEHATMSNEELEAKLHSRSGLFFEKLLQQQQFDLQPDVSLKNNITGLVYPEYANPSLVSQPEFMIPLTTNNNNEYRPNFVQIPNNNHNHQHHNQHHSFNQDNSMKPARIKTEQMHLKSLQHQQTDHRDYDGSRSITPVGTQQTATLFRSDINPNSNQHQNSNQMHSFNQHQLDQHQQSSLTLTLPKHQQEQHQQGTSIISTLNVSSLIIVLLGLILFTFYLSHKWTLNRVKHSHHNHHHHLSHTKDITSASTICSSLAFSMNHASSASSTSGSSSLAPSSTGTNFPPLNKFMMDPSISYTIDSRYPTGPMQLSLNPQGRSVMNSNYLQSADLGYIHQQQSHTNPTTNITNPAYLLRGQQHQQPQQALIINQFEPMRHNQTTHTNDIFTTRNNYNNNHSLGRRMNMNDNYAIYDANDYATIAPDFTTSLEQEAKKSQQMTINYDPSIQLLDDAKKRNPFVYNYNSGSGQSPEPRSSSSSTQAIADFLSLPGRQNHQKQPRHDETCQIKANHSALEELMTLDLSHNTLGHIRDNNNSRIVPAIVPAPRTIARGSHIDRELDKPRQWEVERYRLKIGELLDEGQFGQVYRCLLDVTGKSWSAKTKNNETDQLIVAVKTLKKSASNNEREREELLAEIEIMKLVCDHTNVVKILHCCTKDIVSNENPIYLIMEYAELGKLKSFLEKSRESRQYCTSIPNSSCSGFAFVHEDSSESDHTYNLTSRDLIKFIYHVAKGMEYISSKSIVHRDLATRNILVSSGRMCKIGDFGMARQMNPTDCGVYERKSPNTKVPVRWMAPEVLLKNCYTTKSDVFSFGILMWEIVTLASTPYWDLKTEQVIDAVARCHKRPDKPDYCHELLYDIMSKCWQLDPQCRPTFRELVKRLDNLVLSSNDYIELDQYPDHNYYNIQQTKAPNELL